MPAVKIPETEIKMEVDSAPVHLDERIKTNGLEDNVINKIDPWKNDQVSIFSTVQDYVCIKYGETNSSNNKDVLEESRKVKNLLKINKEINEELTNFLEINSFIFITPVDDIKTHKLFEKFSTNHIIAVNENSNISQEPQTSADGLEVVNVVSRAKVNLPPLGEVIRKELVPGAKVYVMKTCIWEEFVEGIILSVRDADPEKLHKVRFESTKTVAPRLYTGKQLAYRSSPEVILPVGTRIVARYMDGNIPRIYAGIVAEPPKSTNRARYLVFFDDGYAQYLEHKDVYLMCTQSHSDGETESNMAGFYRTYLQKYPERPMVKLQKNQYTRTEYNKRWWNTQVLEVDASMVKMFFLESKRVEWLYRGSARLQLLYDELKSAAQHRTSGKHRRHNIVPRKKNQPYVEYTRETIDISSDAEEDSKLNLHPRRKTGGSLYSEKRIRNTARKSTCMKAHFSVNGVYRTHAPDVESHMGNKLTHSISDFKRVKFDNHICSSLCREKVDPTQYIGNNPFLIPIYVGWERQIRHFRSPNAKVSIVYRSPCGKLFRTLQTILDYLIISKSRVTIDYFSFDTRVLVFRYFSPKENVKFKTEDLTQGKEKVPVSAVNIWSHEGPEQIEYATKRFPGKGVFLNEDKEFLCGCSCKDNCQNSSKCECQGITNYAYSGKTKGNIGYKFRRLQEQIITGIYECNDRCKCGPQCGNRVIQNGLQVRLQMFKTRHKGWGIRCLDDLEAGTFICIYAGQLLTEQGADEEGNIQGDEYLAELDHIEVAEKTKEGYESDIPMDMDVDHSDVETEKESTKEEEEEEDSKSEEVSNSSDSDLNLYETDSDFESALRNTAATTYTTRSRKRKHGKSSDSSSSLSLSSLNIDESTDCNNKKSKELPDISRDLDSFAIVPRPLSPASAAIVESTELQRTPILSENGLVAKKSSGINNSLSSILSPQPMTYGRKSIRSYYGEDSLYIMDAKCKGNIGRYLNHSCTPNVFVQNVFVETHDLRFPEVAFFAQTFIIAGTELTWDYNYEVGSVADKLLYCYCDNKNCRGRLL